MLVFHLYYCVFLLNKQPCVCRVHYLSKQQYDKLILVATGVGLTPMLSLIDKYSDQKECHILWTTRDRHMVKHFNAMLRKCHSTVWFTNKDINAKQQFEQLQHTLNSTLKQEIDSAATTSTNTSYHSSSQDLNNIESNGTTSTTHVTNSSNGINSSNDTGTNISSERDRVSADIVTLLEQGWPTHWNRQLTKTPTNGTRRRTTKQVMCNSLISTVTHSAVTFAWSVITTVSLADYHYSRMHNVHICMNRLI
jgi:Ferric reductase NAD binding domain